MSDQPDNRKSAYKTICALLEQTPGLPYAFQNPRTAGESDVSYTVFHNDMPAALQSVFAKASCDELILAVEQQSLSDHSSSVLNSPPLFTYADAFLSRLRNLVEEKLIDADQLYRFGLMLARESPLVYEVKLGIFILSQFPNDITKSIMRTLGYHSEFTSSVILAMRSWPDSNEMVFDFAKNTIGYGRVAAVFYLQYLTVEQKKWAFFEALKTPVSRDAIARDLLSSPDMVSFYEALSVDEEAFHALSRLFAYAFNDEDAKDYKPSRLLIDKYMEKADQYIKDFIDLAALVMIHSSMLPAWSATGVNVDQQNGWSSDHQSHIMSLCDKYWHTQEYRLSRLLAEMDAPAEDSAIIMRVLHVYTFIPAFPLPDFRAFESLLDIDPFDVDIANFLLLEHPEKYAAAVADRILAVLPSEVIAEPDMIDHDDLSPEHKPDIWLLYLLKARQKVKFDCEQICLSSLSARLPDVRIEAITALRLIRAQWSRNVIPALERACPNEPDPKIAKRIMRLLGIKSDNKKEQRYVEIDDVSVSPSAADKPILNTEIAGTFFRDMDVVTGVLDAGDTLFLKREPENKYDGNAILVTTEDGYVLGYIPKVDNPSLAQFMDAGERLYATLEVDPAVSHSQ